MREERGSVRSRRQALDGEAGVMAMRGAEKRGGVDAPPGAETSPLTLTPSLSPHCFRLSPLSSVMMRLRHGRDE